MGWDTSTHNIYRNARFLGKGDFIPERDNFCDFGTFAA